MNVDSSVGSGPNSGDFTTNNPFSLIDQRVSAYIDPVNGILTGVTDISIHLLDLSLSELSLSLHDNVEIIDITVNGFPTSVRHKHKANNLSLSFLSETQAGVRVQELVTVKDSLDMDPESLLSPFLTTNQPFRSQPEFTSSLCSYEHHGLEVRCFKRRVIMYVVIIFISYCCFLISLFIFIEFYLSFSFSSAVCS